MKCRACGKVHWYPRAICPFCQSSEIEWSQASGNGTIEKAGIGLTNAGPVPVKASAAEAFLAGKKPDAATLAEAARIASEAASPSADRRGSVEYKRNMARVLTKRALVRAVSRAQAGGGR